MFAQSDAKVLVGVKAAEPICSDLFELSTASRNDAKNFVRRHVMIPRVHDEVRLRDHEAQELIRDNAILPLLPFQVECYTRGMCTRRLRLLVTP